MDLSSLNKKQYEAVTAPLGPVLVLAGAGSGKTRVLAFRIAYLCEQKLVGPSNILALTFTNKAAKEMQDRVQKLLSGTASGAGAKTLTIPHMGTFHSMCAKILRQEISVLGYTKGFTIYDSDDQTKIVREIIQELNIDKRFAPSLFRAYISSAKNILQTPAEMAIGLEPDLHNLVREVYSRYQNYLYHQNALDFDDLLMLTVKIFQTVPATLEKYRALFRYILVDEYQDTNHAQYVFLHLLSAGHHNLFVVGDDAQSIYGFRGSNIRNILNFEEDFPEATVIKLEQNYRSTKNILAAAQKVIELNPEQKPKTLWTQNDHGPKVKVRELEDEVAEAQFIAKKIIETSTQGAPNEEIEYEPEEESGGGFSILDHFLKKAHKKSGSVLGRNSFLPQLPKEHLPLTEYAILFRTHAQSRALEEVLIQSGIPYQIIGGLRFYERKEIKDVLAYLRLAINFRDLVSLKRVLNEPARGIGEKTYGIIKDLVMRQSVQLASGGNALGLAQFRRQLGEVKFGPKIGTAVDSFFSLIDQLAHAPESESLTAITKMAVKVTHYEQWLRDGTEQGEARWENVEELFTVTEKYQAEGWKPALEKFLEEVALITEADENQEKDCVTLMTLHSAKGLEFDTVFLTGLEEGILPHSRSLFEPSELSEEIRLAYVGLTRARKNLYLTYTRHRRAFGNFQYNQPSRILRALPEEQVEFQGRSFDDSFLNTSADNGEERYEEMPF